jgi:hypothetical protein
MEITTGMSAPPIGMMSKKPMAKLSAATLKNTHGA